MTRNEIAMLVDCKILYSVKNRENDIEPKQGCNSAIDMDNIQDFRLNITLQRYG